MKHIGNAALFAAALSALVMFSQRQQVSQWHQQDQVYAGAALALGLFVIGIIVSVALRSRRPSQRSRTRRSQQRPRQYQDV